MKILFARLSLKDKIIGNTGLQGIWMFEITSPKDPTENLNG